MIHPVQGCIRKRIHSSPKYGESLISNQYLNSGKTVYKVQTYSQRKWADYTQVHETIFVLLPIFFCQKNLTSQRSRSFCDEPRKKQNKSIVFQLRRCTSLLFAVIEFFKMDFKSQPNEPKKERETSSQKLGRHALHRVRSV